MGVDAERRAGDQRHEVVTGLDAEGLRLGRLDHPGVVHLVGEHLAEDLDDESVADLHLVQPGEHLGLGQAAVAGDHRVGSDAPDRQRRALEMAEPLEQGLVGGAVVDGQVEVDRGDLQPRHEPLRIGGEHGVVVQGVVRARPVASGHVRAGLEHGAGVERVVVGPGPGQLLGGVGLGRRDVGRVVADDLRLVVPGDPAGHRRIGEDDHADEGEEPGQQRERGQAPRSLRRVLRGSFIGHRRAPPLPGHALPRSCSSRS